jgi:flagellar biosynthesis/type III secretory pathway protein FliH
MARGPVNGHARAARPVPLSALAAPKRLFEEETRSARRVLFGESFDPSPPPPEPEIIAPTFGLEDLELARSEAFAEGHAAGLAEAAASQAARETAALEATAKELAAAAAAARAAAERTDARLAEAVLAAVAAQTAEHAARLLPAQTSALLAELRANLGSEIALTVTAAPAVAERVAAALREASARRGVDLPHEVAADPSLDACAVRVAWTSGEARLDLAAVAAATARILAEAFGAPPPRSAVQENAP